MKRYQSTPLHEAGLAGLKWSDEDGQLPLFPKRSPWLFTFGCICLPPHTPSGHCFVSIIIDLIPEFDLHSLHRADWHKTTQLLFFCYYILGKSTFALLWPAEQLAQSSSNCVTPDQFPLYSQQAVAFYSWRGPPMIGQALCIPHHLHPGTQPCSHTGPPSWSWDLAVAKNRQDRLEEILLYSWGQLLNGVGQ